MVDEVSDNLIIEKYASNPFFYYILQNIAIKNMIANLLTNTKLDHINYDI